MGATVLLLHVQSPKRVPDKPPRQALPKSLPPDFPGSPIHFALPAPASGVQLQLRPPNPLTAAADAAAVDDDGRQRRHGTNGPMPRLNGRAQPSTPRPARAAGGGVDAASPGAGPGPEPAGVGRAHQQEGGQEAPGAQGLQAPRSREIPVSPVFAVRGDAVRARPLPPCSFSAPSAKGLATIPSAIPQTTVRCKLDTNSPLRLWL